MLRGLGSDLRQALRVLRGSPGFTLVAVLSLGIGIGANTAMYGVIRTVVLAPLPVDRPEELALVTWRRAAEQKFSQMGSTNYPDPAGGERLRSNFSYDLVRAMREATPAGASLTTFSFMRGVSVLAGEGPAVVAGGVFVDGAHFATIRPRIPLGRGITADDDAPDAQPVVVLSHEFWQSAFGGDPGVVGRVVRVNNVPAQVIGVTGAGFRGMSMGGFFAQSDITLPLHTQARIYPRMSEDGSLFANGEVFWLRAFARIPGGMPRAAVAAAYTAALRETPGPASAGSEPPGSVVLLDGSHGAQPVPPETAGQLFVLLAVVAVVLLIACMNLASLMLARGVSRQREMAVRAALGGGRARLLRQALVESLLLGLAGTALGLALTNLARPALGAVLTSSLGYNVFGVIDLQFSFNPVVLAVTAGIGLAAVLGFGLLPALRLSAVDPMSGLKRRGAGATAPPLAIGRGLIAFQIAVSVPLLVGALLFLRTLANLGAVPLGFDPGNLVLFRLDPSHSTRPESEFPALYRQVLDNVQAIPGVQSVTLIENAPLSGITSSSSVTLDGEEKFLYRNAVGPSFTETMRMRLLEGRAPGARDTLGAPLVGALNETAVRELFHGVSPIGRTLEYGNGQVLIVGVMSDSRYQSQREEIPPTLYSSALQVTGWGGHHVMIRTAEPPARIERAVRDAVSRVSRTLPVPRLMAQSEIVAQSNAKARVFTQLLTLFGAFALLLASIGLHGITAYAVTRRTGEFGVRLAVGAQPGQVLWLVLRQVVVVAGIGLAAGIPASLAAGRTVRSLLFGVAPESVAALSSAALLLLLVAVAAGLVPAWRAARLDPLTALRSE